jgi:hypothetical protein
MHVRWAKVINCLILDPLVCLLVLWILCFQMYGALLPLLLDAIHIMLVSLMTIVNSLGCICCVTNPKCFNASKISNNL